MYDPPVDPAVTAGVRAALTGNEKWALTAERAVAQELRRRYPGLGRMTEAAYEWHRVTAGQAVTGNLGAPAAAGLVFCGAGLRPPGLSLHAYAAEVTRPVRVVYADPGRRTAEVNEEFLAAPSGGLVSVAVARSIDAAAVLSAAPVAELAARGPLSVHLVLCLWRWPPGKAPQAIAGYKKGLPPGSTLCMTVLIPDRDDAGEVTPEAAAMTEAALLAGGPAYAYTPEDVAGWIDGAGMKLAGGVHLVRTFRVAPRVPGRVHGAVAVAP